MALVGTALLSGCSERQEASATLPPASAAPPTSAAALPPLGPPDLPMPDEARAQTPEGAQAFVRYYIDLINRTSTVMDAAPLREFSDGCRDCNRIATNVEEHAALGHDYQGGQVVIGNVLAPVMGDGEASVPLYVGQTPLVVRDGSGTVLSDESSDEIPEMYAGIGLRWDDTRQTWLMQDFTVG